MKSFKTLLLLLFMTVQFFSAQNFEPVKDLAKRQFPWIADKIIIEEIPKENGMDVFSLITKNNRLYISASSVSAASRGLDWYVKHYARQSVSHFGNNVKNISTLPEIDHLLKKNSFAFHRYALNYCTINYSFSFYTWKDWEKELDWMALNGVNIMLAPVGTELVWYNTLLKLGYTDAEAKAFIPGPAFTAWWLMGNLEGWGGPVSMEMMKQQAELQQKILKRMKEFGIEPVLQGFYGMVPHDLQTKLKEAKLIEQGKWAGGFQRPAILDPTTVLFSGIADLYYSEMKKLYGNDIHYFGGEPFHEGGKTNGLNLTEVAKHIQESMQRSYPQSTWVLQGWQQNPHSELLKGLKKENTLVIELFGENTANWEKRKGYENTSFIWSNVSNFGEKNGLYGKLQRFIDEVFRAKDGVYGSNLKGVGIIPEGIYNNPVAYDLMLDLAWYDQKPVLDEWLKEYTLYRYGKENEKVIQAWKEFVQTVYSSPEVYQEGPSESIFCARPSLAVNPVSSWGTRKRNYDEKRFQEAVKLFVAADNEFKNSETYQADKIDVLRQVWANKGNQAYDKLVKAIGMKDPKKIEKAGAEFLNMISVQNALLGNNKYFTLNRWLNEAAEFGKNLPDTNIILYNAKSQLTYWGPDNNPKTDLRDYAHKEWNGLLGSLYYKRWERFINDAKAGVVTKPEEFYRMEIEWSKGKNMYVPVKTNGKKTELLQNEILK
ncbi:alpha-N-acetylglucosaminidase [Elizabethkingia meningoseptica]|uniref:alpha-N-acetylglucosaminidase n=1 Tax=Elizabethkingia meningoseptica TaxID=238 RepID=UPI000332CC1B|nr:alpha-N-acetylglucosaminidase [Elizabethkingia meningoseptica]AQX04825.1 alpha-N-acetylglucosaminidase [Elizabethkingia meningoseptica]AQX46866.1 alpha-N-acetylglucosaminidase [Elizabethkingia meningoseptica]EOR28837.1 Alpha-N-acetylglucosaminidase, Alpha-L-fucosidase [Elizabethkingia meningoseptica ATCC 13253 = NBRC 12535]KUY16204.1 alpha-N-acetylglucosaminidase [Elizabethkingia meningoseptica]OPB72312.1 alpha-N-acetylglucosaminidase [Elizabethkingia meningoseptica]